MLEFLTEVIEEAKTDLLKAGIPEADVVHVLDYRVDHAAAYSIVARVISTELAAWREMRYGNNVTEQQWDYFDATGETSLYEVRKLKALALDLRKAWRERVNPFYREAKKRPSNKKPVGGSDEQQ